jgi:hypothetical protein
MKRRLVAATLWLFAGWYFGATLAFAFGVSPLLGPVIGLASAFLIAGDPRGIIWKAANAGGRGTPR